MELDNEQEYFLKLYEMYFKGYHQEADRVWTRFKICLIINSGIFGIIGVLWGAFIQKYSEYKALLPLLLLLAAFLAIFGFATSIAWYFAVKDSKRWQTHDIDYLAKFEDKYLFFGPELEGACQSAQNELKKPGNDAVDVFILIPIVSAILWVMGIIIIISAAYELRAIIPFPVQVFILAFGPAILILAFLRFLAHMKWV